MQGLMRNFFPEATPTELRAFSEQLPEFRLSMAKLQGHFLKHRDSLAEAVARAKDLLDVEERVKTMSIDEWLRRLNLAQFARKFKVLGQVKTVQDLAKVGEGDLMEFGLTLLTERKRVLAMMGGEEDTKQLFRMQSQT